MLLLQSLHPSNGVVFLYAADRVNSINLKVKKTLLEFKIENYYQFNWIF